MSNGKKKKSGQGKNISRAPLPNYKRGYFNIIIIAIVVISMVMMLQQWQNVEELRFDQFQSYVENGYIDTVTVKDTEIIGTFNEKGIEQLGDKVKPSFVVYYKPNVYGEWIGTLLKENNVKNDAE